MCFLSLFRALTVQKSSIVFDVLLLGVCGRFALSCIYSCLCSGGFLHGLRVNIHYQLCTVFYQPETKESNRSNEGKGWIEGVTYEIQHLVFLSSDLKPHRV